MSEDGVVEIRWFVRPNQRFVSGKPDGFRPLIAVNGTIRGSSYGLGYDRATALRLAEEDAIEESKRYTGDWKVVVRQLAEVDPRPLFPWEKDA